jgi:hypothetical protein
MEAKRNVLFCGLLLVLSLMVLNVSAVCQTQHLYPVTITATSDAVVPMDPGLFGEMELSRQTPEYRNAALNFFTEYYGIDPSNTSLFEIIPFALPSSVRYSIVSAAIIDQQSRLLARTPISNAYILDDGYVLLFLEPVTVFGTFGGSMGQVVGAGAYLVYGNYRFMADCPHGGSSYQITDTVIYQSICPLMPVSFSGTGAYSMMSINYVLNCQVIHPVWGVGRASGSTIEMGMMGENNTMMYQALIRMVHTYPASLPVMASSGFGDIDSYVCEDIYPRHGVCPQDVNY